MDYAAIAAPSPAAAGASAAFGPVAALGRRHGRHSTPDRAVETSPAGIFSGALLGRASAYSPFSGRQSRCGPLRGYPDIVQRTGAQAPRRTQLSSAISWQRSESLPLNSRAVEVV